MQKMAIGLKSRKTKKNKEEVSEQLNEEMK